MDKSIQEKVEKYVRERYKKTFEGKEVIIQEGEKILYISNHKDASPFLLQKSTLGI